MATVQNVNFVQYGRRKGKEKAEEQHSYQEAPTGLYLPNGTDLRQVTVLRRGEYNRIHDGIFAKQRAKEQALKEKLEKQKYHAEAKEFIKTWPNTILGERQKRLNAKKLREEADEKEKQRIDLEEAQYLAECRKKAIEEAKTKQYYQTDRVRGFHSALLLTEVLKEREHQVELNKMRKQRVIQSAPDERKMMQEQLDAELAETKERDALKAKELKLTQNYQLDQWKKRNNEAAAEREANLKEQERLRQLHKLYEMEQEKLKQVKKATQQETKRTYNRCVENKNIFRALDKEREEEENEEIRVFAESKRKLNKMRFDREMKIRKERELKQDKMAAHVKNFYEEFESRLRKSEDHIQKDVEEREAKREREKMHKKSEMIKSIKEHRKKALDALDERSKEEKKADRESLRRRIELDLATRNEEAVRVKERHRRAKHIQSFRVAQINERAEVERQEHLFDVEAEEMVLENQKKEEQQFHDYTTKVIEESKSRGRNIYPLVKAARAGFGGGHGPVFVDKGVVRPSYMTADRDGKEMPNTYGVSTSEIKGITDGGEAGGAKKRLGFVW